MFACIFGTGMWEVGVDNTLLQRSCGAAQIGLWGNSGRGRIVFDCVTVTPLFSSFLVALPASENVLVHV